MVMNKRFPDELVWYSAKIIKPISFRYTNSTIYHNPSLRNTIVWYTQFDNRQELSESTEWFVITKRKKGYCIFDIFNGNSGKEYFKSTDEPIQLLNHLKEEFEQILKDFANVKSNSNLENESGFLNTRQHKEKYGHAMRYLYKYD